MFRPETRCALACGTPFIAAFRAWSKDQPVQWRNKAGEVTASRARSAATTEKSVLQLAAVLNHAADSDPPRSGRRPVYKPLPRKQVSRSRRHRVDVPVLAQMLSYAAQPDKKRHWLHAFLIASICTLARPDAVVDIYVAPEREQWFPGSPTLDLNPFGRAQRKGIVRRSPFFPFPVNGWRPSSLLTSGLMAISARASAIWSTPSASQCSTSTRRGGRRSRSSACPPGGNGAVPAAPRSGDDPAQPRCRSLKSDGFMGHGAGSTTETHATGRFTSVREALDDVIRAIEAAAPCAICVRSAEVPLSGLSSGGLR